MNQEKIGKLIAELRKQKGLTQSELGDLVGVGDRAVSKWERGITTPNIAIINELSKILGISSNELLAGELKESIKETNQSSKKLKSLLLKYKKLFLIIIGIIFIAITTYFILNNHQHVYVLKDNSKEYDVEGKVVFTKDKTYVLIEGIAFYDNNIKNASIINYEYRVHSGNKLLFRSGYIMNHEKLSNSTTVREFLKKLKITFNYDGKLDRDELAKNGLNLQMSFLTPDNNTINEELIIYLTK